MIIHVILHISGLFETSKPYGRVMWKYARVEMKPPTMAEFTQAQERLLLMTKSARSGAWKNLTVKVCRIYEHLVHIDVSFNM